MFRCECNFSKSRNVCLIVGKVDKLASDAYEFLSGMVNGRVFLTTFYDDAKFSCFDLVLQLGEDNHIFLYQPNIERKKEKNGKKKAEKRGRKKRDKRGRKK